MNKMTFFTNCLTCNRLRKLAQVVLSETLFLYCCCCCWWWWSVLWNNRIIKIPQARKEYIYPSPPSSLPSINNQEILILLLWYYCPVLPYTAVQYCTILYSPLNDRILIEPKDNITLRLCKAPASCKYFSFQLCWRIILSFFLSSSQ